jgi:hypothetical protein
MMTVAVPRAAARGGESYLYGDVITGSELDVAKASDAIAVLLHAAPPSRRRRERELR